VEGLLLGPASNLIPPRVFPLPPFFWLIIRQDPLVIALLECI